MAIVTAPRNGIPIGLATIAGQRVMVEVHPEYLRWFESLTGRVGGVTGPSTTELAMSQFEDAGIEELKATVYALADELRSLPPVVQLPQVAATGGGATWTEAEVDFGSKPVYTASFTITDAGISAASKVQVLPCGKAATGRTADDWAWDGATFAALPASGSATCYAVFSPGPIVGRRKVQYSVGA
jgi:hypothetical protein